MIRGTSKPPIDQTIEITAKPPAPPNSRTWNQIRLGPTACMRASDSPAVAKIWLALGQSLGFIFTSEVSIVEITLDNRLLCIS